MALVTSSNRHTLSAFRLFKSLDLSFMSLIRILIGGLLRYVVVVVCMCVIIFFDCDIIWLYVVHVNINI